MRLVLSFMMISIMSFAMQTCSKSGMTAKSDSKSSTASSGAAAVNTNAATPAPTAVPDDAPRISLEDAKKDFDKGNVVFIDTRGEESYKVEHIKGSLNIPLGSIEDHYKELPKDKKIIAYCS